MIHTHAMCSDLGRREFLARASPTLYYSAIAIERVSACFRYERDYSEPTMGGSGLGERSSQDRQPRCY